MADSSPAIANIFLHLAERDDLRLTQMQLQKLVYISHGWNLAINDERLTTDDPRAWDYGPVYDDMREALKRYGSKPVTRQIRYRDYWNGRLAENPGDFVRARLTNSERDVVDRVYRDYGKFHAFKLSALTHENGTPWTTIYNSGQGQFNEIPADLIRRHFIGLARGAVTPPASA